MSEWLDPLGKAVSLIITLIGGAVSAILWLGYRSFARRSDHNQLAERVSLIEQADRSGPTHQDLTNLRLDHASLSGKVEGLQTDIGWIKSALGRIESYLMRDGGGS